MGLFDFVKNAGAKIGIGKSTGEEAAEKLPTRLPRQLRPGPLAQRRPLSGRMPLRRRST